jgi:Holliday junction resolvase RusA-like endonuclease
VIEIHLAGPPIGKQRVRRAAAGHAYTPEKTVSFEGRLAYAAQLVMGERPPLDGPLCLDVKLFLPVPPSWPNKRRAAALAGELLPTVKPDWDNGGKLTDALNQIVWLDDRQIVDGRVRKAYSDRPRTEVRVWRADTVFD